MQIVPIKNGLHTLFFDNDIVTDAVKKCVTSVGVDFMVMVFGLLLIHGKNEQPS